MSDAFFRLALCTVKNYPLARSIMRRNNFPCRKRKRTCGTAVRNQNRVENVFGTRRSYKNPSNTVHDILLPEHRTVNFHTFTFTQVRTYTSKRQINCNLFASNPSKIFIGYAQLDQLTR